MPDQVRHDERTLDSQVHKSDVLNDDIPLTL